MSIMKLIYRKISALNKITQIPHRIDREELFERMHISKDRPNYQKFKKNYQKLFESLPDLLNIQATHILKTNDVVFLYGFDF